MRIPARFPALLVTCVVTFTGCTDTTDESPPPSQELVSFNSASVDATGASAAVDTGAQVTTNVVSSSSKAITSFSFNTSANPGLSRTLTGTLTGTSIAVVAPPGTNLTGLVASYFTNGASVAVGGVTQVNGATPNNFTNQVIYRVTAADGTTQDYVVAVAPPVTSFSFTLAHGDEATFPSDGMNPLLATPPVMSRAGDTPFSCAFCFAGIDWQTPAANPDHYFSFTVTPVAGATMTLFGLTLKTMRSGPGPVSFSMRSSRDNFAADLQVFTTQTSLTGLGSALVFDASFANLTTPVEIRLHAFDAHSLGYFKIDDVQLIGSIVP